MNLRFSYAAGVSLLWVLFSANASAQSAPAQVKPVPYGQVNRPGGAPTYETQGSVLVLTVYSDTGVLLDRQAVVKLYNKNDRSVIWRTTQDKSVATFEDVPFGTYDIEVSAFGYLTAHQELKAQLELLDSKLDDIAQDLERQDTDRLLANRRFLEQRFGMRDPAVHVDVA